MTLNEPRRISPQNDVQNLAQLTMNKTVFENLLGYYFCVFEQSFEIVYFLIYGGNSR